MLLKTELLREMSIFSFTLGTGPRQDGRVILLGMVVRSVSVLPERELQRVHLLVRAAGRRVSSASTGGTWTGQQDPARAGPRTRLAGPDLTGQARGRFRAGRGDSCRGAGQVGARGCDSSVRGRTSLGFL